MIKKFYLIIAAVLLFQVFVPSPGVQAVDELTVKESSAEILFPAMINFTLSAESDTDITDVRLHYFVERRSYVRVTSEVYVTIIPGRKISTEWSLDMRKTGGLPPGTVIYYWWSLENSDGDRTITEKVRLLFDDNRFHWKTVKNGDVSLFWYEGDEQFAAELLSAATEGLVKLKESTGAELDEPVAIYIYENSSDLQNAMIFPQTWTGGVAYPSYSKVAIGIEPSNLDWGTRTIAHELTHLVIHQVTYNPYIGLPTWLDEGLAMNMEGPLTGTFIHYLTKALENNTLISVRSLTSPFSAYADQSYLSYAESYSLVDLLINRYGQEKMLELLTVLSEGTDYDEALDRVYGFDMDGLDSIWRAYLEKAYNGQEAETENTVSLPVPAGSS